MKIIILNGAAGAGKTTFKKLLKELYSLKITSYSSITWAKEVAKEKFNWDGIKDEKSRKLLSAIKKLGTAYDDIPFKKIQIQMKQDILNHQDLFIVDMREPDEIDKFYKYCLQENLSCLTVRIQNTAAEKIIDEGDYDLEGDKLYGAYDYDCIIENNATLKEFKDNIDNKLYYLL